MNCTQCGIHLKGEVSEALLTLCFSCQMQRQKRLAGFTRRALAFIVDNLILTILTALAATFFGFADPKLAEEILRQAAENPNAAPRIPNELWALYFFLPLIYFAGFESSRLQATPGKFLLRIYVTDMQGQKLSFWRAIGRYLGKIVSSLILNIGYLLALFTAKKQALHDLLAHTIVVKHRQNPRST